MDCTVGGWEAGREHTEEWAVLVCTIRCFGLLFVCKNTRNVRKLGGLLVEIKGGSTLGSSFSVFIYM